mgnify:CR=1 FL=1
MSAIILEKKDIVRALMEDGMTWRWERMLPAESVYLCPDMQHLQQVVFPYFWADLFDQDLTTYHKWWDCNKFSVALYDYVCKSHAKCCLLRRNKGLMVAPGISFGFLLYDRDQGGKHALNFAIVNKDGDPRVVYVEPQNRPHIVTLSAIEKLNVTGGMI